MATSNFDYCIKFFGGIPKGARLYRHLEPHWAKEFVQGRLRLTTGSGGRQQSDAQQDQQEFTASRHVESFEANEDSPRNRTLLNRMGFGFSDDFNLVGSIKLTNCRRVLTRPDSFMLCLSMSANVDAFRKAGKTAIVEIIKPLEFAATIAVKTPYLRKERVSIVPIVYNSRDLDISDECELIPSAFRKYEIWSHEKEVRILWETTEQDLVLNPTNLDIPQLSQFVRAVNF